MRHTFLCCGILGAAAGVFFGFANPVFYFPPLVFLFLVLLNRISFLSASPRAALRSGLLLAAAGYLAGLYWVVVPVRYYGHLPWALAVPAAVLLAFYVALFAAVYVLLLHYLHRRLPGLVLGIFAGCLWACLEIARQWLFGGFPWLSLGSAFAGWPQCIQAAGWIGEIGLSASIACMAMWISQPTRRTVSAAFVLGLILLLPGFFSHSQHPGQKASLLLVQGNIDQSKKWTEEYKELTLKKYKKLTRKGSKSGQSDVVIWPETAMPFYVQETNEHSRDLRAFVRAENLSLVLGAPGYEMLGPEGDYKLFNRAFFLNKKGKIQDVYDKMHLVPFGEYVPLKSIFPFLNKLTHGVKDFSPGERARPLQIDSLALGMLICYEVIYSGQVQSEVQAGANLLVNMSNDAWFGRTSAPLQHLYMAAMRAVEQNRFMARATNTGISAFISPSGRILEKSDLFQSELLHRTVSVSYSRTFFSRHYLAVHAFFFILAGFLFLYAFLCRGRGHGGRK